jgi:hypothetical protein
MSQRFLLPPSSGHLLITLMMEAAASASETLISFNQTIRRYNPEDSHLHIRRRENLMKSYKLKSLQSLAFGWK